MTIKRPPVGESAVGKPFWDGTREQKLRLPWCTSCRRPVWYPREVCPRCLTADGIEWRDASGRGTVYAVSVQHQGDTEPYAVVLVDLDEGVRMMSNAPVDVQVGEAVEVTWEALDDGRNLPQWRRA